MKLSPLGAVVVTALALVSTVSTTAAVAAPSERVVQDKGSPKVTMTLPLSVVEGDPLTIEAKVSRTKGAKQVQLQRSTAGTPWTTVGKAKARKKKKYAFHDKAGAEDAVRYRIKVLYDVGHPVVSEPGETTVWHWVPMTDFDDYASSLGVNYGNNVHIHLNGVDYPGGWETSGKYPTWTSGLTPGRHCNTLRGIAGVADESADGSSAVITVVADGVTPVYTSPSLTPGMAVPFQVPLATPFRLALLGQRTSLPLLTPYPAIADPELLCTGLAPR